MTEIMIYYEDDVQIHLTYTGTLTQEKILNLSDAFQTLHPESPVKRIFVEPDENTNE